MSVENSTSSQTFENTTKTILDSTELASFFDPAWQLMLTVEFYFQYAVIAIGLFGTAANALLLYALIAQNASEAKKRAINLLIINQNVLDLSCCILLVVSLSLSISDIYLTGAAGYFICTVFINGTASHSALYGSIINLVAVTIERYLKVVHPFWSKRNLNRWVVYAAMTFAWVAGVVAAAPLTFITSRVEGGFCFAYFESTVAGWMSFVLFFLFPLVVFVYCYVRMAVVMRKQMRVMEGHNVEGSSHMTASQAQSKRIKWNIIRTMIIVSVAFIVCWIPHNIFFFILAYSVPSGYLAVGYYPTVFLVYLNVCMNPFIYAIKHEGVKSQLARLMTCRKPSDFGDASGSSSNRAAGTQQTRAGVAHK